MKKSKCSATAFRAVSLLLLGIVIMVCPRQAHCQSVVEAWVQRYGGPVANRPVASDDRAEKVAVDSAGNVIVAGSSSEFSMATTGTSSNILARAWRFPRIQPAIILRHEAQYYFDQVIQGANYPPIQFYRESGRWKIDQY